MSNNELQNELKICKEQILQLNLENEELSKSLFKLNEKFRDSEQMKGHFISNIRNEIVNPFASILALAKNLKQLKEGEILQVHRMAELIFIEAFHLDFQLRNIFAAAMIESGKESINNSSINFHEICEQLVHFFNDLLKKKNIQLIISFKNFILPGEPILFISDKDKIVLILRNLEIEDRLETPPRDAHSSQSSSAPCPALLHIQPATSSIIIARSGSLRWQEEFCE